MFSYHAGPEEVASDRGQRVRRRGQAVSEVQHHVQRPRGGDRQARLAQPARTRAGARHPGAPRRERDADDEQQRRVEDRHARVEVARQPRRRDPADVRDDGEAEARCRLVPRRRRGPQSPRRDGQAQGHERVQTQVQRVGAAGQHAHREHELRQAQRERAERHARDRGHGRATRPPWHQPIARCKPALRHGPARWPHRRAALVPGAGPRRGTAPRWGCCRRPPGICPREQAPGRQGPTMSRPAMRPKSRRFLVATGSP
jgi:hypothetical protein